MTISFTVDNMTDDQNHRLIKQPVAAAIVPRMNQPNSRSSSSRPSNFLHYSLSKRLQKQSRSPASGWSEWLFNSINVLLLFPDELLLLFRFLRLALLTTLTFCNHLPVRQHLELCTSLRRLCV